MSSVIENSWQTYGTFTESIELRQNQEQELDQQETEFNFSVVTQQSVSAQFKLATELILRQV